MVPYSCQAYSYIKNRPKLEKLQPRAHIGYLVGYDSTNVFRIWIPTLKRVISTRHVVFDTTKRYTPWNDQSEATEEVIQTIQELTLDLEDQLDDWETIPGQEVIPQIQDHETLIDAPGDTIIVQDEEHTPENSGASLPTPEATPIPDTQTIIGHAKSGRNIRIPSRYALSTYHSAFLTGSSYMPGRIHSQDLPPLPKSWR